MSIVAWFLASAVGLAASETGAPPRAPIDLRGRPVLGRDTAPLVVVEVTSFKCNHCRTFHEEVFPKLREQYIEPGKVQWVVLNASDENADEFSRIFAIARCALRLGKYWEMVSGLFRVAHRAPSALDEVVTRSAAIDRAELEVCLRDPVLRRDLADDFAEYARLQLRGTPTFLIWKVDRDGRRTETLIKGGQKLEYFQRAFDQLLKGT